MANDYTVAVANTFEAESFEDAIRQMVAWLDDSAMTAGYRISYDDPSGEQISVFIDASHIFERDYF